MARFRYRMQSILDLKLKTETQARNEYGIAQHALNVEQDRLEQLRAQKAGYEEEGRRLREGTLVLLDIQANSNSILAMDDRIARQMQVIAKAEEAVEAARMKLMVNIQERKMQESLREKAFEEFLVEEKAAEAKENDERTSYTYGAKAQAAANSKGKEEA